ncbi:uncharacterized protein LOC118740724 isoform X1 [Rhagoletis pomonella]|uniref:uncharacterized protein LOC118740724 isoform X1 n=1 Tax=Rhagoletis pomonella TaxID=28610 RepID=UPI001783213C|nr:uncharacterized protein LOC118740724 isoform X1 [Rhagoletis pomonella]
MKADKLEKLQWIIGLFARNVQMQLQAMMRSKCDKVQLAQKNLPIAFFSYLSNNEESNVVSVAKKKKYEMKFKREWASKYNWLQEDSTAKQGKRCMICGVPIYGNMFHIDRHANSDLHKKNANIAKATLKISSFTKPNSEEMELSRSAKAMEIRLCMFVAEHNLPFTALGHLA